MDQFTLVHRYQGPCRPVLVIVNQGFGAFIQRLDDTDTHLQKYPETELVVYVTDYWNDTCYSRHCTAHAGSPLVTPEMVVVLQVQGLLKILPAGTYGCPVANNHK
ncbi:MAG: hypothetical protein JXA42_23000 [Anaerolineales bacterium]|nr:hypothetical protein [Anaerolineales bacterium]